MKNISISLSNSERQSESTPCHLPHNPGPLRLLHGMLSGHMACLLLITLSQPLKFQEFKKTCDVWAIGCIFGSRIGLPASTFRRVLKRIDFMSHQIPDDNDHPASCGREWLQIMHGQSMSKVISVADAHDARLHHGSGAFSRAPSGSRPGAFSRTLSSGATPPSSPSRTYTSRRGLRESTFSRLLQNKLRFETRAQPCLETVFDA